MSGDQKSIRFQDILDQVELAFEAGLITPEQIAKRLKLPVWLVNVVIAWARKK